MRCFACDVQLSDGTGYDKPTDRFYCQECLTATNEVILGKELRESSGEGSLTAGLMELLDTPHQEDFIPLDEVFPDDEEEEE